MNGEDSKDIGAPGPVELGAAAGSVGPVDEIEDMDEARLAAELDAEFDEIRAEIDRINLQERVGGSAKKMLLQQYRKARKASRKESADRPPWRVRLDEAIETTIDKFVEDGLEERADGSIALVFKSELIGTHGIPLLTALLDAMREGLKDNAGKSGPMAVIGPHIIQFIENFRTSFAGAPPEDTPPEGGTVDDAVDGAADGDADPTKAPKLPPLSIEDVFKGFSGLMAAARASAPKAKPKGKGQPSQKGGKTQTTTFTMKTPDAAPTKAAPAATSTSDDAPKSDGPTINIDFAGLFGSLLKGMTAAKPAPPPKATRLVDKPAPPFAAATDADPKDPHDPEAP